jgi:hypothetical protein
MQTAFKLAYSLAVAILTVLFVILGILTFYEEPVPPSRSVEPFLAPGDEQLSCDFEARCFKGGRELTLEDEAQLTEGERLFVQERREFYQRYQDYEDDEADHDRNVLVLATALGVMAVVVGLCLFRRIEALPLGLLLGGVGAVLFGWVQADDDLGEIGMAPLFAVVAVGLAIVLAGGYWYLGARGASAGNGEDG